MSLTARDYYTKDLLDELFDKNYTKAISTKCDIYQKDGEYHVEMEMPGINKEDIVIDLENGYLTVTYNKNDSEDYEDRKYIRRERRVTSLERRFYVGDIDESSIKAEFKNGILEIAFPIENKVTSKKNIQIK